MRRMSSVQNVTEPIDKVWQNAQDLKFQSKTVFFTHPFLLIAQTTEFEERFSKTGAQTVWSTATFIRITAVLLVHDFCSRYWFK